MYTKKRFSYPARKNLILLFSLFLLAQTQVINCDAIESSLTIQPSEADTFVNSMYLQHKYPEEPHGYFWAMFTGNMYTEYDSFKGYGSSRIYIKFNATSIPSDAKIISTELCLYMYDSPKTNQEFEAYRVLSEWNEHKLTWINQPDFAEKSSSTTTIQPAPSAKWICWEITEDVRMWHSGAAHNYGTMIRIKNEVNASDQVASFYPSETLQEKKLTPKLTIKIDWHKQINTTSTLTTSSTPTTSPTQTPPLTEFSKTHTQTSTVNSTPTMQTTSPKHLELKSPALILILVAIISISILVVRRSYRANVHSKRHVDSRKKRKKVKRVK